MEFVFLSALTGGVAFCGWVACYSDYRQLRHLRSLRPIDVATASKMLQETENKRLDYVCVKGTVRAVDPKSVLEILNRDTVVRGVIHQLRMKEHRRVWSDRRKTWEDVVLTRSLTTREVPFAIASGSSSAHVIDWQSAKYFKVPVEATRFDEVSQGSAIDGFFDFVSGNRTKGFETTDHLLAVGTPLLVAGQLFLTSDGVMVIRAPLTGQAFIMTTEAIETIITQVAASQDFFWWFSMIFTAMAGGFLLAAAVKTGYAEIKYRINRFIQRRRGQQQQQQQQQQQRPRQVEAPRATEDAQPRYQIEHQESVNQDGSAELCVVCMSARRSVALLNCGHICVCETCVQQLPRCPLCREQIVRVVRTFVS